jgi:hypothetical protein
MLDVGKEEKEYDGWKDAKTKMCPMGITKRALKEVKVLTWPVQKDTKSLG